MLSNSVFILVVAIMAIAAFATRIAGAAVMSRVTPTARTQRFLEGLSVSVIAALVASQLMTGDTANTVAVAIAVLVMLLSRSVVWAMFAGMMSAAAIPLIFAI